MTIKVRMVPHLEDVEAGAPSGIQQVIKQYFRHLPAYGIELVGPRATSFDLLALHAGAYDSFMPNDPIVAHCHGLYWTDDYEAAEWEQRGNARVVDVLRHAQLVTVPSAWVAEAFCRDMHFAPAVVPHGVDWQEWQGGQDQGYILWNKNRNTDVCDPAPVNALAELMPDTRFLTTYAADQPARNVRVLGTVPHEEMKQLVKNASLYLATTKETFGIGTLEALAAGVPVLAYDHGAASSMISHGHDGYLAQPGDYADLLAGAKWIKRHRQALSANARETAKRYSWHHAAERVAFHYGVTVEQLHQPRRVGVVIPCFNKAATLERAVRSVWAQTQPPAFIMVVDNNSTDGSTEIALRLLEEKHPGTTMMVTHCFEQGVAHARNHGIRQLPTLEFICCLDADDEIKPQFLERCLNALKADNSLAIAYTGIEAVREDGSRFVSDWPGDFDYEQFIVGKNQVPTCCVFRREMWRRAGGYRQRFAPGGAGSEDAELWLRIGALGGNAKKVSNQGLFVYHLGGQVSGDPNYREKNWREGKPWIEDKRHPFASIAKPVNGVAHLVRQVDQPLVSVIIPVGPGHVQYLTDCLDSVEAQSNRQWEVIVVADCPVGEADQIFSMAQNGFPYMRLLRNSKNKRGAGVARNIGAAAARAPFLLFLDADDRLTPNALNLLLAGYQENPLTVVYGEYIGYAYISDQAEVARLRSAGRLLDYDAKTSEAKVLYRTVEYDCEIAMRQPNARQPYIWNTVTSLVPAAFHANIGGFDEQMESWEDWDYWLRLARAGECFTRVEAPVLEYRFYTGGRRALANPEESGESGRQLSAKLLEYMSDKYERSERMACKSCGGGRSRRPTPAPAPMLMQTLSNGEIGTMTASDFVQVELIDGNVGSHRIVFERENYGYRSHGEVFLMKRSHAQRDNRVRIVEEVAAQSTPASAPAVAPASAQALVVPPTAKRTLPERPLPEHGDVRPAPDLDESDEDEYFDGDEDDVLDDEADVVPVTEDDEYAVVTANLDSEGLSVPGGRGISIVDPVTGTSSTLASAEEGVTLVPAKQVFDFTQLFGIGPERQNTLVQKGIKSLNMLIALEAVGIAKTLDVPEKTAERILQSAKEAAAQ